MVLEELIQHYYLKNLNKFLFRNLIIFFLLLLSFFLFYNFFIKKINIENFILNIPQNSNLKEISKIIENNNLTSNYLYPYSLAVLFNYQRKLSYGEFLITNQDTLYSILKKIRFRVIHYHKLTIVEGYEAYQLDELLHNSLLEIKSPILNLFFIFEYFE